MKYYIIAGERSGDLHASNLARELIDQDRAAQIRGMGGELMEAAGVRLFKHYRDISFMGFAEVLMNISKVFKAIRSCQSDLLTFAPDVLILVDFAGFNLRVAKFAKKHHIKVYYYISPKIWAWKQSRVHTIKKLVDKMYVIMPFEKDFYQRFNYSEVYYIGNPILDAVTAHKRKELNTQRKMLLAVLPGSRPQEVKVLMDILPGISGSFPDLDIVVAGLSSLPSELYDATRDLPNVRLVLDQTYDLLTSASVAIVTSGTATLETALFRVPQVVVYKANKITYAIAKRLIKVKWISLVNLIAGKEIVKELIQKDLNVEMVKEEISRILPGGSKREFVLHEYHSLIEKLGAPGASRKAAKLMLESLKGQ